MELDLRDYIKVIRKRLWMIISIVLAACIVSAAVSYLFMKPVYEASTKLIVNKSNDQVSINPLTSDSINTNLRLIDTYKEIIKTPAIMDLVAKQYPQFNLSSEQLISKIKVSSVNNTQVMTLAVQDYNYALATQMVNAVSNVFKQEIPKIMKVDNVSILNEAKTLDQPVPVKPNPILNIAISFVVALMTAIGLAFLLEYLDDTIKTESDVEQYLGLPTLAMISRMKEEDLNTTRSTEKIQAGETKHVTINQ